jgi:hypothetical protein
VAYLPHDELVAVAWLKGIPGVPATGVGTTLPGDNSTWAASGYLQVSVVGGSPDRDVPMHRPLIQVDSWAVNVNGAKPPWGKANQLAEVVVAAGYGRQDDAAPAQRIVTLPANYQQARVHAAYVVMAPRRILEDDARFARYQMDLQMAWSAVPS